jgi:pre-mRNA-splicing helicase BRR2
VLVFVHSRKETAKTARFVKDSALQQDKLAKFVKTGCVPAAAIELPLSYVSTGDSQPYHAADSSMSPILSGSTAS